MVHFRGGGPIHDLTTRSRGPGTGQSLHITMSPMRFDRPPRGVEGDPAGSNTLNQKHEREEVSRPGLAIARRVIEVPSGSRDLHLIAKDTAYVEIVPYSDRSLDIPKGIHV